MPETKLAPHPIDPSNVDKIRMWLAERGGLALWRSINFSNIGASWTTPVNDEDGNPKGKPTWEAANEPERIITDPAEVVVAVPKEVKRFHVAIRQGSQGMTMKLTDGATRRVRAAVAKAGEGAWYEFDYGMQDAVIYVADKTVPLTEWKDEETTDEDVESGN